MTERLDQLIGDVEHTHPVAMLLLAKRLFDADRQDEAVFWLYEGQIRWRSYLIQKPNPAEKDRFERLSATIGPDINWYAAEDVPKLVQTIDSVLDWDGMHPDDFTPSGKAKDSVRNAFKELKSDTLTKADAIKKVHDQKRLQCPTEKTTDDPFPCSGGAAFGTPQEMLTAYSPQKFAEFHLGTTTKSEIVYALGRPELWSTAKDGSSRISYSYLKTNTPVSILGLSQRIIVTFSFDAQKVLTSVVLPQN